MKTAERLDTHQKALRINLDKGKYGVFAEIGAGQEVARWFFRVGGAAGTIAKSISAYDMIISDAIYGPSKRYVSRQRLEKMLEYEYGLLHERLKEKRGSNTRFFVFADTVTARSYTRQDEGQGWLGVRLQVAPERPPSEVIIHVRMLDKENVQQQETLGAVGVNLIYGALYLSDDPDEFVASLMDGLNPERLEVDMIRFSGPDFAKIDNRIASLQLVQKGLSNAAMFNADGEVIQASDFLYKKPILVERGSFRPVTKTTAHMLECAMAQLVQEPVVQGQEVVVLLEMTLKNLTDGGVIDPRDFLDRVDILSSLGRTVLISNYLEYHRLASYFFRYTNQLIGVAMGVPTLKELFDEKHYTDLAGGILESFGRLFRNGLRLYVYPAKDTTSGSILTAGNLRVASNLRHLYSYLIENQYILGLRDFEERYLTMFSRDALTKIRAGDASWEELVPASVAKVIKERKLLGFKG